MTSSVRDGLFRPVCHGSKALTESQQGCLSQVEVECFCIISALLKEPALTRYSTIILSTDCRAIQFMVHHAASYGKLQRWMLFLQSLDIVWNWEPSSHPAIRWVDCAGRVPFDTAKKTLTKKPRFNGKDSINYIDFYGAPPMSLDQAHGLISAMQQFLTTPAGVRLVQSHHAHPDGQLPIAQATPPPAGTIANQPPPPPPPPPNHGQVRVEEG